MNTSKKIDLFHNPMIESAKKALTPEQIEEYKKIGQYMYNSVDYKTAEMGSAVKPASDKELVFYAEQALRSGLNPFDLSNEEIRALINFHGEKWYQNFGYKDNEVPKPFLQIVSTNKISRR